MLSFVGLWLRDTWYLFREVLDVWCKTRRLYILYVLIAAGSDYISRGRRIVQTAVAGYGHVRYTRYTLPANKYRSIVSGTWYGMISHDFWCLFIFYVQPSYFIHTYSRSN